MILIRLRHVGRLQVGRSAGSDVKSGFAGMERAYRVREEDSGNANSQGMLNCRDWVEKGPAKEADKEGKER